MIFTNKTLFARLTPLTLFLVLVGCSSPQPSAVGSITPTKTSMPSPTAAAAAAAQTPAPSSLPVTPNPSPSATTATTLMVTHSKSDYMSFLDPASGKMEKLVVGKAPFAIAEGRNHRAYVSTAEGVAVIDTKLRTRLALVPYQANVGKPNFGEYRSGGMGIAVSPDGKFAYIGVYLSGGKSQLEILDTEKLTMTGRVPVGVRPFDVVTSLDGREVYSIDHDGYTVTAVDPFALKGRTLEAAPFGKGGFEKPHYAAVRSDGRLLLPYQGRGLVVLDPKSGNYTTEPLTGNTHQEGVTLTPDGTQLLIVGIGSAGSATGKPNLTVLDVNTYAEKILPLSRMHQMVASSADGRYAYLTGGVTYADTGWNGMTVVDLSAGTTREFELPDYPLDVQLLTK
ncbi:DNA-binding beta-propeller fold protein YncE [Paenibacillus qinlingensis]|uniref:DNA-binding beta-propeller fold protein YncE n=2 Tax=Paenibacillus qinlingensis TaxID=1837343 RepID=A0ABU1P2F9_9BACL|nr:DNA-binding beta-propeller fold protein YncE [Paenibacillus qinlingensis]